LSAAGRSNVEGEKMKENRFRMTAGILVLVFFLIHAGVLVQAGEPYHILWSCHLACLMVGIALLVRLPWLHAVGFLWLALGVPLWLLNIITSRDYMLTSTLSHIGGLIIAVYGLRFEPMPRFSWAAAAGGLVVLGGFSRLVTPRHANVNLSFAVWQGWEDKFSSYFWYVVMLLTIAAVSFWMLEIIVRRFQAKVP
jgi:hypothetical protein